MHARARKQPAAVAWRALGEIRYTLEIPIYLPFIAIYPIFKLDILIQQKILNIMIVNSSKNGPGMANVPLLDDSLRGQL